ncbi:unnamed protein product, partial [Hapterophycus canaliculatus]
MDRHPHSNNRSSKRRRLASLVCGLIASVSTIGCGLTQKIPDGPRDTKVSYHDHSALKIEYPQVAQCATPVSAAASSATSPLALQDPSKIPSLEITLQDA